MSEEKQHQCINGEVLLDPATDRWGRCPVCAVATRDLEADMRFEMASMMYAANVVVALGKSAPKGEKRAQLVELLAKAYRDGARRKP